jgi:hypothetical protein
VTVIEKCGQRECSAVSMAALWRAEVAMQKHRPVCWQLVMHPSRKNRLFIGSVVAVILLEGAGIYLGLNEIVHPSARTFPRLLIASLVGTVITGFLLASVIWRRDVLTRLNDLGDWLGTRLGMSPTRLASMRRRSESRTFAAFVMAVFALYLIVTTVIGLHVLKGE